MAPRNRRWVKAGFAALLLAIWFIALRPVGDRPEMKNPVGARPEIGAVAAKQAVAPQMKRAVTKSAEPPAPSSSEPSTTALEQMFAIHDLSAQMTVSALLERNAEEAAANVEKYCEKAKALGPVFKDSTAAGGGDAGPFFVPLVDWYTGLAAAPAFAPQRRGALHLPEELVTRIDAAKRSWVAALGVSDIAQLDFGWMTQALQYDHWSLAFAGPTAEPGADLSLVAPDFNQLLNWAKLRYVKALAQQDLPRAALEVRHLAYLVHTTGGTIADNISLRMTGLTGAMQAAGVARDLAWIDPVALTQSDDLSRAGAAFFWPGVDPAVMKRAQECAPSPCAAFVEGAFMRKSLGQLSPENSDDGFWPLGANLQSCDSAMLDLVKRSPPKSNEQALRLLQTLPKPPLERVFPVEQLAAPKERAHSQHATRLAVGG
jgi:hypothetical protein